MFDETRLAPENGVSATVKIKDWILLDLLGLLNIIPILGWIAYLVIILIIAFSEKTALSMKYRVLANLIWIAVSVVIWLLFLFVFGGLAMISDVANNYYY